MPAQPPLPPALSGAAMTDGGSFTTPPTSPTAGTGYSRGNWFFWSDWEKENLARYQQPESQLTRLGRVLRPLLSAIADRVPDTVAPNVLTAAALMCLFHALYLSYHHAELRPASTAVACATLVSMYGVLDYIDGLHAQRIRNESNLGALMVTAVNATAPTLLAIIMCLCMGIRSPTTQWYAVQSASLFFLFIHIRELHGRSRNFVRWFIPGPAAIVPIVPLFLLARAAWFRLPYLQEWWGGALVVLVDLWHSFAAATAEVVDKVPYLGPSVSQELIDSTLPPVDEAVRRGVLTLYALLLVAALTAVAMIPAASGDTDPRGSRWRILICIMYRAVPATFINQGMWTGVTLPMVVVDGFFIGVLITDLEVSKMAQRCLHPWVVLMCGLSIMDHFLELSLCACYYISVFWDISEHMKLPLFTVVRNVYVDGIYDLCHIGHKNAFKVAAQFGNGLIVGVINDEDATPYKRKPIMTHEERCREVAACKYVSKVVPNAPCNGISEEFIRQHGIHVVVCGREYFDNPNDKYYCVPRKMGILTASPRTQGISTSELIGRILAADSDSLAAKDKLRGESLVSEGAGAAKPK